MLILCVGLMLSDSLYSQDCGCVDCPVIIEDQSVSVATFVVNDADDNSLTTNKVKTVFIKFTHSFPSELQMRLISPAGQAVTLIGPQGTFSSAVFFGGFNISFVSNIDDVNPDPGMTSAWNNANLSGLNQYLGAYIPYSGSLQNFNTGTLTGSWQLEITDPLQFDTGELEEFSIIFEDQDGINCCEAIAGDIVEQPISACPSSEDLLIDIEPQFLNSSANEAIYDYTFLVFKEGVLIDLTDNPDLRMETIGTYQIYGLSYDISDQNLLPTPNGTFTIEVIQDLLSADDPLFCADLTSSFLEVNILDGNKEFLQKDTICSGATFPFGDQEISETGIYRDTFSLGSACDSISILDLLVAESTQTQIVDQTCEPNLVGLDTITLVDSFGCDSLVITETILLPNDTVRVDQQTCDQVMNGLKDTLIISTPSCDSILITTFFYIAPDTSFISLKSCLPDEVGVDTMLVPSSNLCGEVQIVSTTLYAIDTTFLEEITCDLAGLDSIVETFPTDSCDRVEVTTFISYLPDTTYLSTTTCEPLLSGFDTSVLNNVFGCDSLIITEFLLLDSDTSRIEQFSCNLDDAGVDTISLQNQNFCDSIIITTTIFSESDTTFLQELTCDFNQLEPLVQTLNTEQCDSIVITEYVYSAPDTTILDLNTCDDGLASDTSYLQNQFGCDSLLIQNYTYIPPDFTELYFDTCDPLQVGTSIDTLSGILCDSIITTVYTLLPSDTTNLEDFVCDLSEVRLDSQSLINVNGCDSIVFTNYILEEIEQTVLSSFTCDPDQVGLDTVFLSSSNNCDSLIINEFLFAEADTTVLTSTFTCDPDQVKTDTLVITTATCDSIVISTTELLVLEPTSISSSSCDIDSIFIDTLILESYLGCDSLVITTTSPLASSQSNTSIPVSDPSEVRIDTMLLTNQVGCDSLVIVNYFLSNTIPDTSFVELITCDPSQQEDTILVSPTEVIITIPVLTLLDTTYVESTTCEENVEDEILNLVSVDGCDSVVYIIFETVTTDTIRNLIAACSALPQDTTMLSDTECPTIVINTYIDSRSDTTFLESNSCVEPFGTDTLVLQNSAGCDSVIVSNIIEAMVSVTNIFQTSCVPVQPNDTLFLNGVVCDSLVITNYMFEEVPPTILNETTCDIQDLEPDTLIFQGVNGCDSLVIAIKELETIEPTSNVIFTCDEDLLGVIVDTLTNANGCDSIVQTTFIAGEFNEEFDVFIEASSCDDIADGSISFETENEITVLWLFDGVEAVSRVDLLPGDYDIQLSNGACDSIISVNIPAGIGPDFDLEVAYQPCSSIGGNIEVVSDDLGQLMYLWDDGSRDSIRNDLTDGIYTVTVIDALGCENIKSVEIENVLGLDFSTEIERVSCFGFEDGSIQIDLFSGTAPYTVVWDDGSDQLFRDSLPAGNYSVTISDVNNCNITLNRFVGEPDPLMAQIDITEEEQLLVTVDGGSPPYTYLWNDGTTRDLFEEPINNTSYEVTVTDANGCIIVIDEVYQTNATNKLFEGQIDIYPNPSSGLFYIDYDSNLQTKELLVYDIYGRVVLKQSNGVQSRITPLDLNALPQGAYIVEIYFTEGVYRKKVLIAK